MTEDHGTVKLADFGLAREESLTEMMTAETGTYRWMAPEVYWRIDILFALYDSYLRVAWTDCANTIAVIQYCHTEARGEEAL